MKKNLTLILLLCSLFPGLGKGQSSISSGQLVFDKQFSTGQYLLPASPFVNDKIETIKIEGNTQKKVFQIKGDSPTSTLLSNAWASLDQLGFEILFQCATWDCGGFEFREVIDVVESPYMFVNLGDFQFISASMNTGERENFVTILASKSQNTGFVQIVFINPPENEDIEEIKFDFKTNDEDFSSPLHHDFATKGFTILEGVEFDSGSRDIKDNSITHLEDLATFLKENPDKKVLLVGHTDMEGELKPNIDLSTERAHSIRNTLISVFEISPDQISAHGVGFLSPHVTNLTPEGRNSNRRVEALILQEFE